MKKKSKDEKKSIWKKIAAGIGAFFIGVITCLLGGLIRKRGDDRNNRERAERVRSDIDKAKAANRDAEQRAEQLKDRTDTAAELNKYIEQCNADALDIIQRVRERNEKK